MNNLYETDLLPLSDYNNDLEECQECTGCYNNGDWIMDTFYNGNWNDGVEQLLEIYVTPYEFADFVSDKIAEGMADGDFFDRASFITIQRIWSDLRENN